MVRKPTRVMRPLSNEEWVRFHLDRIDAEFAVCSEDLWLEEADDYPELEDDEGLAIVEAAEAWTRVDAKWEDAVFYETRE